MNPYKLSFVLLAAAVVAGCPHPNGAYSPAEVTSGGVVAAANFAVAEQSRKTDTTVTLVKVTKAATQPVGLTNYRLSLQVEQDGKPRSAAVVVWQTTERDEQGNSIYRLSEWEWN